MEGLKSVHLVFSSCNSFSSFFIFLINSSPPPQKIFKIAKDKITIIVIVTRPPNCLTGSGNSFNLFKYFLVALF